MSGIADGVWFGVATLVLVLAGIAVMAVYGWWGEQRDQRDAFWDDVQVWRANRDWPE